ncbi:MAG: PAS domain S-box protein [Methanospirillum sp.]|nr:PAS domain S-box protein [Methanospirillum sp.]
MHDTDNLIIEALSDSPQALMITEIASKCGMNRHTIARKLDALEILGRVRKIEMGNSKRYYLSDAFPAFGLVDISSDLILVINERWEIQYINKSAQNILKLSRHPVIGERIDLLHLELFSDPRVIQGLKEFTPQKVSTFEVPYTFGGSDRWYEISIMNISLKPGVLLIILIAVDITENHRIKQELQENEARYRSLFENAPIAIAEIDYSPVHSYLKGIESLDIPDLKQYISQNPEERKRCISLLRILDINEKCREICRCLPGETVSMANDILPFLTRTSIDRIIGMILTLYRGILPSECELSSINELGEVKYYSIRISVVNPNDNELVRVYASFRNITESKMLYEELVKKKRELISVSEELVEQNNQIRNLLAEREEMRSLSVN